MTRLDLGCGQKPAPGFTGVDVLPATRDVVSFDLFSGELWPWSADSVDELRAHHVIEHIPADTVQPTCYDSRTKTQRPVGRSKDALFFFFDEAFRIAKPGALFTVVWPSLKSSDAFRDPTHRRFLPLEFLHYLSRAGRESMHVDHYNVNCDWLSRTTELRPYAPHTQNRKQWTAAELAGLWDAQCEFTCVLQKPEAAAPLPAA